MPPGYGLRGAQSVCPGRTHGFQKMSSGTWDVQSLAWRALPPGTWEQDREGGPVWGHTQEAGWSPRWETGGERRGLSRWQDLNCTLKDRSSINGEGGSAPG